MQVYWSDFTPVALGGRTLNAATAQIAGADGAQIPITAARCLVESSTLLTNPPAGVRFLLTVPDELGVLVPNAVVTFVNTQLGKSFPFQTFTWRQLFKQLFAALDRLRFSPTDGIDL